jgi:hypothetical protein
MKKCRVFFAGPVAAALAGCATVSTNDAIVLLQTETAEIIGLASSDELTVTEVEASKPDALGGQELKYKATTTKGRIFRCSALMMPGLLAAPPTVSAPSCTVVQSHF